MGDQERDQKLRQRIAGALRAEEEVQPKQLPEVETKRLAAAADKLEQMLAEALAEEEARKRAARGEEIRSLQAATERLEQMLQGSHGVRVANENGAKADQEDGTG